MKKAILLAGMLTLFTSLPARADIVIEPMIITQTPAPVFVAPSYYVIEPARYPVHIDHHRHYDWRYWQQRREHEHHDEHRDYVEHEHR